MSAATLTRLDGGEYELLDGLALVHRHHACRRLWEARYRGKVSPTLYDTRTEAVTWCLGEHDEREAAASALTFRDRAEVIAAALGYLAEDVADREVLSGSTSVRNYLRAKLGREEREVFGALMLDARNRLIEDRALFWVRSTARRSTPAKSSRRASRRTPAA